MRKCLSLIIFAGFVVSAGAHWSDRQVPRGLVIEAIQKGSAVEQAGFQAGDVLTSWSRSGAASAAPVAQGDFRSPFDAREFEIEQLPRGGTSIVVIRQGQSIAKPLTPGFWGISVRPTYGSADLVTYAAGAAVEKDRPTEALNAWQPLIDRSIQAGDVETAAWLLTRAASGMVAQAQVDRGDELFERAAGLFRTPPNPSLEAMVWEAKGEAYFSDVNPTLTGGLARKADRRTFEVALASHERARTLRAEKAVGSLAVAESQVRVAHARVAGLQWPDANKVPYLPATSDGEKAEFRQIGDHLEQAVASIALQAPQSFLHARALLRRGSFENYKDRAGGEVASEQARAAAEVLYQQARSIFEAVAPKHPLLYSILGTVRLPTEPAAAESLLRQRAEVAAEIGNTAAAANDTRFADSRARSLALDLGRRGAYDEAIEVLERLLKSSTSSPAERRLNMDSLTGFYINKGDFGKAEQIILSRRNVAEVTGEQAALVGNVGVIAVKRGDWSSAETMFRRALDLSEQAARIEYEVRRKYWADLPGNLSSEQAALKAREAEPDTFRWAQRNYYWNLAVAAERRGDREEARRSVRRVVEISSHRQPMSPEFYDKNPGGRRADLTEEFNLMLQKHWLAKLEDDLAATDELTTEILRFTRQWLPGTLMEAEGHVLVARRQWDRQDLDRAAVSLNEALKIRQRLNPGGTILAGTQQMLGRLMKERGDRRTALKHLEAAFEILNDRRTRRSAGDGAFASLTTGSEESGVDIANDLVGLLVTDGQFERAFQVLEQGRGRGLVEVLSARQWRDSESVPAAMREDRRRLEAEYEQTQKRIETLALGSSAQAIDAGIVQLHEIRLRLDDVDRRIDRLDPQGASLRRPVALTLAQAGAQLDAGTTLLSYLVGAERTYLFVVTNPHAVGSHNAGLAVYTIETTSSDLHKIVEAFRKVINWDADPATATASNRAAILARGRELYELLVKPAEAQIASAKRLLLSVDGPLHALPFGALVRQQAGKSQFIIEWKALHTTPSMSVYAETLKSRRAADPRGVVVAMGDPLYPQDAASEDVEVQYLTRRGLTLKPLPGTRQEVDAIRQLFGSRAVTYLGEAATEARAKTIGMSARYIHFAVHGVFNDQLPLNSALAFTMPKSPAPGENNGLLQAWEIFEQLRIDADLVTLSACESGLGKEIAGEGLMGLTRAFLYAGARTVNASLWKVADGPTAELMTRFYQNLKAGQTKDEALQNAQVALIKKARPKGSSIDYASPAHWAAFGLTGDWK